MDKNRLSKGERGDVSRRNLVEILRTADHIRYEMNITMSSFGVTGQQYNVLRILAGAAPESLPILEIANRLIERTPGITRFIDQLENMGFLLRKRDKIDRRKVLCSITESGLKLLKEMESSVEQANIDSFKRLTDHELSQLLTLLKKIEQDRQGN